MSEDSIRSEDLVLIATDNSNVDYKFVVDNRRVVVDTRNDNKAVASDAQKVVRA